MIMEMCLWWLAYALVFFMSAGTLSVANDLDSWLLGGCIFILFVMPINVLYFSFAYDNFYLKWFI